MTINTVSATPDMIKDCVLELARDKDLRKQAVYLWGPAGCGLAILG